MIKLGNCVEANKTKNYILLKTYFFIFFQHIYCVGQR